MANLTHEKSPTEKNTNNELTQQKYDFLGEWFYIIIYI